MLEPRPSPTHVFVPQKSCTKYTASNPAPFSCRRENWNQLFIARSWRKMLLTQKHMISSYFFIPEGPFTDAGIGSCSLFSMEASNKTSQTGSACVSWLFTLKKPLQDARRKDTILCTLMTRRVQYAQRRCIHRSALHTWKAQQYRGNSTCRGLLVASQQ